jgi:hypothetical protein
MLLLSLTMLAHMSFSSSSSMWRTWGTWRCSSDLWRSSCSRQLPVKHSCPLAEKEARREGCVGDAKELREPKHVGARMDGFLTKSYTAARHPCSVRAAVAAWRPRSSRARSSGDAAPPFSAYERQRYPRASNKGGVAPLFPLASSGSAELPACGAKSKEGVGRPASSDHREEVNAQAPAVGMGSTP